MEQDKQWKEEQRHFTAVRNIITENITAYEKQYKERKEETLKLFQEVQSGNVELYDQMMTSKSLEEHSKNQLKNYKAAKDKPYFGMIDYRNMDNGKRERIFLGKHGIWQDVTEAVVVDWRTPIATVYYENEPGRGSYSIPDGTKYEIDLKNKRTYDIEKGKLIGFYDSDVAANDELLVKYLSKNREAVLGDIIATIQKEQNEIIRANPFHNIIVQGVAGSGKTTVAMHRISYIMYNYKERFTSNEFCVVGGSDVLIDYITGGLPELEVYDVKHMRMDGLLTYLLKKQWLKKYSIQQIPIEESYKSKMLFIRELEKYLMLLRKRAFAKSEVKDSLLGVLLSEQNNRQLVQQNEAMSVNSLLTLLDERLRQRIKMESQGRDEVDICKRKLNEYKQHFTARKITTSLVKVYTQFLEAYQMVQMQDTTACRARISKGEFDVYDIAAMVLIDYRLFRKTQDDEFGQMFIDEAQDFGPSIYYVLHEVLPACYFTIMGDVSQNINYETGMNSWREFTMKIFCDEKDEFRTLSKSYRNTIEISKYAGKVLKYASDHAYHIDPVIRHGAPVHGIRTVSGQEAAAACAEHIKKLLKKEYETIAVICFEDRWEESIRKWLDANGITCNDNEAGGFQKGVSVMPVSMTKGLEFDCAFLWKPDMEAYKSNPRLAKQIYVACTRALHELFILL